MFDEQIIFAPIAADILSVSKATLAKWERNGKLIPRIDLESGKKTYQMGQLLQFEQVRWMKTPIGKQKRK